MTRIHPTAVVDDGARLADDVEVGPYSVVGPHVILGSRTKIGSHVVIEGHTEIGDDCSVHAFAALGDAPQHAGHNGEPTRLVIGARNLIREHVTMHCGTAMGRDVTTVGSDGFFMVGVHVGHDCIVGDHVVMANNATLGGHAILGDFVIMGGLSAAHQNTRIGRHAFVGGMAGVNHDVIPFGNVWGNHAHLEGLNLVGLKRRGFSREAINILRAAYRMLFAEEGTFQERLDDTANAYAASPEVMEIIEFIRADASRPLTTPEREI
jgi:UDP-N-acetylglucosamine acyltransferase